MHCTVLSLPVCHRARAGHREPKGNNVSKQRLEHTLTSTKAELRRTSLKYNSASAPPQPMTRLVASSPDDELEAEAEVGGHSEEQRHEQQGEERPADSGLAHAVRLEHEVAREGALCRILTGTLRVAR